MPTSRPPRDSRPRAMVPAPTNATDERGRASSAPTGHRHSGSAFPPSAADREAEVQMPPPALGVLKPPRHPPDLARHLVGRIEVAIHALRGIEPGLLARMRGEHPPHYGRVPAATNSMSSGWATMARAVDGGMAGKERTPTCFTRRPALRHAGRRGSCRSGGEIRSSCRRSSEIPPAAR